MASQRQGMVGHFLQGGSYQAPAERRNGFTVGHEEYFEDRAAALAALSARKPSAAA